MPGVAVVALDGPHRRYNALNGEWVLVSPGRTGRPWQGAVADIDVETLPRHDPDCYLCPGNVRANGEHNPSYSSTFVFTNDFAALRPETPPESIERGLLRAAGEPGTCRVVCFAPRQDLTLSQMLLEEVRTVIDLWAEQTAELGRTYRWVQLFENRGEMMGGSNPHPHGQIWAQASLPMEPAKEDREQAAYYVQHGSSLLIDYGAQEKGGPRVVVENEEWQVLVPYWATWPFETLLIPTRQVRRLPDLDDARRTALAEVLRALMIKYDNLFRHPFPCSMGWHGAPYGEGEDEHWTVHVHFHPSLLRSASVRKFMVGYEMLADAQRDITPEAAAGRLAEVNAVHYRNGD